MDRRHEAGDIAQIRRAAVPGGLTDAALAEDLLGRFAEQAAELLVVFERHIARYVMDQQIRTDGGRRGGQRLVDPAVDLLHFLERAGAAVSYTHLDVYKRQAIDCVSGKAADRLRDNQVDLAVKGICNHLPELLTLFGIGAGDAFVRILNMIHYIRISEETQVIRRSVQRKVTDRNGIFLKSPLKLAKTPCSDRRCV